MLKLQELQQYHQQQHNKLDIKIESVRVNDLPEIAQIYEEAFAEHFLGHMGPKFLKLFCAQFMNSPTNYGYVAKSNGRPIAFLFGTIDSEPFHQFYRQNFFVLSLIVMQRYIRDAYVRRHLVKRFGNMLVAFKTLFTAPQSERNPERYNIFMPARLLAIGVTANYRGTGVANQLTSHFCAQMKREGFKKVGLSALAWNERAIRFYKKDGWIQEESSLTSLSFIRSV